MKHFFLSVRSLILTLVLYYVSAAYALVVEVPPNQWYQDVIVWPSTRISAQSDTLIWFIQLINQYLWFSIGIVAFVVLLYGWFQLMTAQGDAAKVSDANKILLNGWIGLFVAILSYAAVRVIVNLF